ncbi:VOC family protein [Actinocrispum wychmicini]|uniref:Glyoxalase-like domain-containing protein n=1 Tax=Actinocrispum wychmicini TaxID=1213861 RepID=A0A4R2J6X9_9PSEU|nr:VOC family protein [Actinocrispum wychmicini]TCO54821.1 hypothetical protein EV192_108109 [Actinocrispum wychmicini]
MATRWSVTFDCAGPVKLAEFWALALGYIERPPPEGFATWDDWFDHLGISRDDDDEAAYLTDPDGVYPTMSFLQVPESKVAKNRVHIDIQAGGGRQTPWETRWPRVLAAVERLTAAGATIVREDAIDGKPDHFVLLDPEGNEFCVV